MGNERLHIEAGMDALEDFPLNRELQREVDIEMLQFNILYSMKDLEELEPDNYLVKAIRQAVEENNPTTNLDQLDLDL